jgi:hypothetical protein
MIVALACKKNSSPTGPSGDQPPAVTAVGTPVGSPVSKNIDASGGSLTSPDGKLDLMIPSGALAANTTISIQPVTNEAPGGIGVAYQQLPEGTTFSKPVTITCHYTNADVSGSLPYFLYIAYQDSTRTWKADMIQRDLDTVAKTVSVSSTHFSIWSVFDDIIIHTGQNEFKESESNFLEVREITSHGTKVDGEDELFSLGTSQLVPDDSVKNWSIDGHGTHSLASGNISGSGSHVNFTAPPLIDVESTVNVSAEVTHVVTIYSKGKPIASFNKLILFHALTLVPQVLDFTLTLEIGDGQPATDAYGYGYTYIDHAVMDLKIDGDSVRIFNIVNYPPQYTTQNGLSCAITSVYPDSLGELNIVLGKGIADDINAHKFNVTLSSSGGHLFKFDYKCNCLNCPVQTTGGSDPVSTNYGTPDFILADSTQHYFNGDTNFYTKFTLTPK